MTSLRDSNLAYDQSKGEHPVHGTWLSVDVIALTADADGARIVLITRENAPHRGATTLPGGVLAAWNNETVENAARRILREKAGVTDVRGLAILSVVSDPSRDERGHTVSIVVAAVVPAGVEGAVRAEDVPDDMPFGHSRMVRDGLRKIGARILTDSETTYGLLGDEVTSPAVASLLAPCGVSWPSARSRLMRSPLYQATPTRRGSVDGREGRPSRVYRRFGGLAER